MKTHGLQLKQEILKHKEKLELIFRKKLDDEKRKLLKAKLGEEVHAIKQDNDKLRDEVKRMRECVQTVTEGAAKH